MDLIKYRNILFRRSFEDYKMFPCVCFVFVLERRFLSYLVSEEPFYFGVTLHFSFYYIHAPFFHCGHKQCKSDIWHKKSELLDKSHNCEMKKNEMKINNYEINSKIVTLKVKTNKQTWPWCYFFGSFFRCVCLV